MNYCTKCGKQNPDAAKFCTGCGAALSATIPHPPQPVLLPPQKKSNTRWILIGSIVLIGLLVGSYFLFFNKAGNKNPESGANTDITNNEAAMLKELVHQWSTSLNKGNAADVASLYAERLVYYHSQMSKGNATVLLSDFFLKNPVFHQEITGEITLEKINNNLIVCNFQKSVSQDGKTTDFPSYLKFSKEGDVWKIVEEGDKITDYNIGKQKDAIGQQNNLNNWIKKNLGSGITIDLKTIREAGFSTSNYQSVETSFSDNYGDYLNVSGLKPQISASKNWILLAFSGEDISINFFLGKEKVFRSYHLSAGSNGGSTSYDLVSRQNKDYPFTITGIKDNLASMYRDGYGFDNNGEPTGHWWQSGTYDIISGNTTWAAKEY